MHGMKTRMQLLESFLENTVIALSSLIFYVLWLSYGKLTLSARETMAVVEKYLSRLFKCISLISIKSCQIWGLFFPSKFDKSQYCIVILTPRAMISRVFKMVIYEIVLGHNFKL